MLSACETFRRDWRPEAPSGHLRSCEACRRWVEFVEAASEAVAESAIEPLSPSLRRSLLAVSHGPAACPADAELAAAAVSADSGLDARRHASGCSRCRPVLAALEAGISGDSSPLPVRLRRRLLEIARPTRPLPVWLRWGDVGSLAASFLLTVVLTLVAGDSAATLFREPVPAPPMTELDDRVRETWVELEDAASTRWDEWSARAEHWGRRWAARLDEVLPTSVPSILDPHPRSATSDEDAATRTITPEDPPTELESVDPGDKP